MNIEGEGDHGTWQGTRDQEQDGTSDSIQEGTKQKRSSDLVPNLWQGKHLSNHERAHKKAVLESEVTDAVVIGRGG